MSTSGSRIRWWAHSSEDVSEPPVDPFDPLGWNLVHLSTRKGLCGHMFPLGKIQQGTANQAKHSCWNCRHRAFPCVHYRWTLTCDKWSMASLLSGHKITPGSELDSSADHRAACISWWLHWFLSMQLLANFKRGGVSKLLLQPTSTLDSPFMSDCVGWVRYRSALLALRLSVEE